MKTTTVLSLFALCVLGWFGYTYYTDHYLPDRERRQAFLRAVETGNLIDARRLLDEGVDVNTKNDRGLTPLQIAAAQGNKTMVDLLVASGGGGLSTNPTRPRASTPPGRTVRRAPT